MKRIWCLLLFVCLVGPAYAGASPWTGSWVWNEKPTEDMWFRKVVAVKDRVAQAKIVITADNIYELYVNGKKVGTDDDWTNVEVYDVKRYVHKGQNVIAVKAKDPGATIGGLLAEGVFAYPDGSVTVFGTDKSWKFTTTEQSGWTGASFDDSSWKTPQVIGKPPVGPWSGVEHPDMVPKSPLKVVDIKWPKKTNPGDTFTVTCRVRPGRRIPLDSPVGLRLLSVGEGVCEQWMEPKVPTSSWKPGRDVVLVFKNFHLPSYVPTGLLYAQVSTTATRSTGSKEVRIGPKSPASKVAKVEISGFSVLPRQSGGRTVLDVRAKVNGAGQKTPCLFALYQGRDMWFASDITPSGETRVTLPKELPGGTYEARLLPHKAVASNAVSSKVKVAGPAKSAWKRLGYGTYSDRCGVPHRWYINQSGMLIWDGKPYVPAGGMYLSRFFMGFKLGDEKRNESNMQDDIKRLTALKAAGITDIYMNPCADWNHRPVWVWQRFADLCEKMGFYYGIQVTQPVRPVTFWDVDYEKNLVTIKNGETAKCAIPSWLIWTMTEKTPVIYAAFDASTGEILDTGRAKVTPDANGIQAEAAPKAGSAQNIVVHFTPENNYNGVHDYWYGINENYKAKLDAFFSGMKLGPNLRNWIDPLDNEQSFSVVGDRLLPRSESFQSAFAGFLKKKYGSAEKLVDAWALSCDGDVPDFQVFGRLIPVGKSPVDPNTVYMLDEKTGRTYKARMDRSAMWSDMKYYRDNSVAGFNNQVAERIKGHHDVPVVLKHEGSDLFRNLRTYGGFDGLGAEAYGTDIQHIRDCSTAVHAQSKRCSRTMWELTTETGLAESYIGYPDPIRMTHELGAMIEEGAKGTYCFLFKDAYGDPKGDWYTFNLFEDPRQLHWLGAYARLLKGWAGLRDYQPGQTAKNAKDKPDFFRDKLGLQILDLGRSFQAMHFGSTTYIWNMTDCDLTLKLPAQSETLRVPSNASKPAIIENMKEVKLEGVNEANYAAACRIWAKARDKARLVGWSLSDEPSSRDWREAYAQAEKLKDSIGDTFAIRMKDVKIDGDLSEWTSVKPLYLKDVTSVNDSKYGNAGFMVGYDDNYLYVACDVKDEVFANNYRSGNIWNGDAVEVFLDLDPEANPGVPDYTPACYQFIFSPTSADGTPAMTVRNKDLPADYTPKHSLCASKRTASGWQFEIAISTSDINGYRFRPGAPVGFSIEMCNSDGGDRTWARVWRGGEDGFKNRLGFGRLGFGN